MSSNPYDGLDAYTASETILFPLGVHEAVIQDIEDGTSSGGHPQVTVTVADGAHSMHTNIVLGSEFGLQKFLGMAQAAGVPRPTNDDVIDGEGRLDPQYLVKFLGKPVRVKVEEEPSIKDRTKMYRTINGFLESKASASPRTPEETASGLPF